MGKAREEKIIFSKAEIQDGLLRRFRAICPGALEVYLVLRSHSSDKVALAKVGLRTIRKLTGIGFNRILDILDELKDAGFIGMPMRDLPFKDRSGKSFIYEIKNL